MSDTLIVLATIGACFESALTCLQRATGPYRHRPDDLTLDDVLIVIDEPTDSQLSEFVVMRIRHNASPERRGIVGAYNAGFAHFLSEPRFRYLILLEDGVRVRPGWDTAMRRALENHPEMGWTACGQEHNDLAPFTSLCSMMTRECAEKVRGLDPLFAPCQFDDGDLMLRCLAHGFRPEAVPLKIQHPVSRTSRVGTEQEDIQLMLNHQQLFAQRWGYSDLMWNTIPVHHCERCG